MPNWCAFAAHLFPFCPTVQSLFHASRVLLFCFFSILLFFSSLQYVRVVETLASFLSFFLPLPLPLTRVRRELLNAAAVQHTNRSDNHKEEYKHEKWMLALACRFSSVVICFALLLSTFWFDCCRYSQRSFVLLSKSLFCICSILPVFLLPFPFAF